MQARQRGQNDGTAFERELELLFEAYTKQGRAKVHKVDPPTKTFNVKGKPGMRRTVNLANPFLDFTGAWTEQGGRALLIEAKHTEKPRLPLGGDEGLTAEQWANAMDWHRAGAMVLILWRHAGEVRVTTPALAMAAAREYDRKSIRWADAHRLPAGYGFIRYDPLRWAEALL